MANTEFDWFYMNAEVTVQYDLFEKYSETDCLRQEIIAVKRSADKVRRGVFQRLNSQGRQVIDMEERITALEKKLEMLQRNL